MSSELWLGGSRQGDVFLCLDPFINQLECKEWNCACCRSWRMKSRLISTWLFLASSPS